MKRFYWLFVLLGLGSICHANSGSESGSGSGEIETSGSESGDEGEIEGLVEKRSKIPFKRTTELTFPEILQKSMKVSLGDEADVKEIRKTLEDYYFTDKEQNSVWPKAINETEENLNLKFDERELFEMENDIKQIYRRMLECDLIMTSEFEGKKKWSKKRKQREQAKCYFSMIEIIYGGYTDFGFPRGSIERQAKVMEMGLAYNVMSILILQMTRQMSMKANISPKMMLRCDKTIIDIAENMFNFNNVAQNTRDAREQAISRPEICQIVTVFWVDFRETCETRQKRNVDAAAGIGGPKDKFVLKYQATVTDNVTGKEVCSLVMETSEKYNRRQVKEKLTNACEKKRNQYVKKIRKEIQKFYSERVTATIGSIKKMWEKEKKKAAKALKIKNRPVQSS